MYSTYVFREKVKFVIFKPDKSRNTNMDAGKKAVGSCCCCCFHLVTLFRDATTASLFVYVVFLHGSVSSVMCPSSGVVSVVIVTLLLTSISSGHQQDDEPGLDVFLPDAPLVVKQFYQTIESAINHLVVSRDMHRAVRRHKRQLGGLLGGGGGGGGGGPLGSLFQGDFLDGLTNLAQLGSLNGLTAVPDDLGPVAPIL